jgi:hypothetical protein
LFCASGDLAPVHAAALQKPESASQNHNNPGRRDRIGCATAFSMITTMVTRRAWSGSDFPRGPAALSSGRALQAGRRATTLARSSPAERAITVAR